VVAVVEQVLQEKQVVLRQEVVMAELEQILVLTLEILDPHVQYLQVVEVEQKELELKEQVVQVVVVQQEQVVVDLVME
tara:strand:- start:33 stop:266 length:234 start_codon:yes stop_codon:yes gene_type:complete